MQSCVIKGVNTCSDEEKQKHPDLGSGAPIARHIECKDFGSKGTGFGRGDEERCGTGLGAVIRLVLLNLVETWNELTWQGNQDRGDQRFAVKEARSEIAASHDTVMTIHSSRSCPIRW